MKIDCFLFFLCSVDRASQYIRVVKTNLMHYLSTVYFVNQPLHISGIFVAQEVYCTYTTIGTCFVCTYVCVYIYDEPQICPKHVEVD